MLTRGPVHEAFAQPVSVQDQPGMVVPSQPPANITETPPADRPDGNACIWAPGYWNWDAERNNYIWVSGCWRLPPPKMAWVPGYWTQVAAGWQWVPGFWSPVSAQEIAYLPAPPAVTDLQPPGPPPAAEDFWVGWADSAKPVKAKSAIETTGRNRGEAGWERIGKRQDERNRARQRWVYRKLRNV